MKKLQDKVALVTGGSRGIGAAIVYALAGEGANVGVNYAKNRGLAEQVCANVQQKNGVRAIALKADVSVPKDVQSMVDTLLKEFGKIDILVNNAAVAARLKLAETSLESWNETIAIDLTGTFLCTKAVLPSMLKRKQGRIINIASTSGQIGGYGAAYSAAKGGILAFTKTAARELARDGILVNCVAPGITETDMIADYSEERRREQSNSLPLGRFCLPREIATSVVFLASPDADVYVGQTLRPNGGFLML